MKSKNALNQTPMQEIAEEVLLSRGIMEESITLAEGPRDPDVINAIIRDVRRAKNESD